jgi:hypothetical protein
MVKYDKVVIKKSTKPGKKLMAVFFTDGKKDTSRTKTIHFGAAGMDDYTITKDKQQKKRYISRHQNRENWNVPDTAGSLARWVLWNKETRGASIIDYKNRFNLK